MVDNNIKKRKEQVAKKAIRSETKMEDPKTLNKNIKPSKKKSELIHHTPRGSKRWGNHQG